MQNPRAFYLISILILFLSGCSAGQMKFHEVRYLAVPSGDNLNVYRVTVKGYSQFTDAKFRSGWYPASAVDGLYGDVSNTKAIKALKVQEEIREEINKAILISTKKYLKKAIDPNATKEELRNLLKRTKSGTCSAGTRSFNPNRRDRDGV